MPCTFTDYYKYAYKATLKPDIENCEEQINMYKDELISLASLTPYSKTDCEGAEIGPESWIPDRVNEIMRELNELYNKLIRLNIVLNNEQYDPENNFWGD